MEVAEVQWTAPEELHDITGGLHGSKVNMHIHTWSSLSIPVSLILPLSILHYLLPSLSPPSPPSLPPSLSLLSSFLTYLLRCQEKLIEQITLTNDPVLAHCEGGGGGGGGGRMGIQ